MSPLKFGVREIVAVGLLVLAVVAGLAVTFLRDDDGAQQRAAEDVRAGRQATSDAVGGGATYTPIPTQTPTPTPTPGRRIELEKPAAWVISFYSLGTDDSERHEGTNSLDALDLSFNGPPFPDLRDNSWKVVAETGLHADAGRWVFTIEYQGDVRVMFNNVEVAKGSSGKPAKLDVAIDVPALEGTLRIEATDTYGPFVLRWP